MSITSRLIPVHVTIYRYSAHLNTRTSLRFLRLPPALVSLALTKCRCSTSKIRSRVSTVLQTPRSNFGHAHRSSSRSRHEYQHLRMICQVAHHNLHSLRLCRASLFLSHRFCDVSSNVNHHSGFGRIVGIYRPVFKDVFEDRATLPSLWTGDPFSPSSDCTRN